VKPKALAKELQTFKVFFDRSISCLKEEDSTFAPAEGMRTVAQTVSHVAQTVDWFLEGAFREEGFDMAFEKYEADLARVTSLAEAKRHLDSAFAAAEKVILTHSEEEWSRSLPEGPVMGGSPRFAVISGLNDHTAHHRGALTVYARLRGHMPAMPYM
jgi:uncharacterized damage-inducible protein DinB